jgi:hypothetical protein
MYDLEFLRSCLSDCLNLVPQESQFIIYNIAYPLQHPEELTEKQEKILVKLELVNKFFRKTKIRKFRRNEVMQYWLPSDNYQKEDIASIMSPKIVYRKSLQILKDQSFTPENVRLAKSLIEYNCASI